jgi:hypothetical protein
MVAMIVVPFASYMLAEFHKTVRIDLSALRIGISTTSQRSPDRVRRICSKDSRLLLSGKSIFRGSPSASAALSPVNLSKAWLNLVILNEGSQTMIGALA